MPRQDKVITFEITPEQFLNACSPVELMEIEVLIMSPRYQALMANPEGAVLPIINPKTVVEDEE